MKLLSVSLCLVVVAVAVCSASKSYPVPVFVWSESDKFMPEGRTWHSRSVSTDEVREYVLKMSAPHSHSSSESGLPLSSSGANPEVIVMFLEPGLFFGRSELVGGTRLSKDQSQLKKLKLMVEGAKSSVIVPYSYDDAMGKLTEEERSYFLITKLHDTFDDYFSSCKECHVIVEPMDSTAKEAWSPFFFSDNRIREASSAEEYMHEHRHSLFHNGRTDLIIVHLPSSAPLPSYDSKISSVISSLSEQTKDYVAILSSDDMYLPTRSTEMYRENPEKLEWKERRHVRQVAEEEAEGDTDMMGEYKYPNRWPEFVWEFLICWFLMLLIFSYGFCCLFGMDTPLRFDNPKEKCL